jgi:hypothetical protein
MDAAFDSREILAACAVVLHHVRALEIPTTLDHVRRQDLRRGTAQGRAAEHPGAGLRLPDLVRSRVEPKVTSAEVSICRTR